jgi:hypothetical protein
LLAARPILGGTPVTNIEKAPTSEEIGA